MNLSVKKSPELSQFKRYLGIEKLFIERKFLVDNWSFYSCEFVEIRIERRVIQGVGTFNFFLVE